MKFGRSDQAVSCDESGLIKFPFSYLAHVTLLTPAQVRLSPCSGFAQAGSPLLTLLPFSASCDAVCQITSTLAEGAQNWFHK